MVSEKPLHRFALVTGRALAGVRAARTQTKALGIAHHHGEHWQSAVEHSGPLNEAVAPEQDVALGQIVDPPIAERAQDFLEDGALVALAGRWFLVSRIVSPEAFGVVAQQGRVALLRGSCLLARWQTIQRHLCQFRPRKAAGRGG